MVVNEPRYENGDLIDSGGVRWTVVTGWLDPHEVVDYQASGVPVAIDECAG